jgi:hypothetical protein
MNNLEIRHEIATLRAAMLEIVHRLEKLSAACVAPPPREVIHTRRVICVECGVGPDDGSDNLPPPYIEVFGTAIQVTPMESEIMRLLLKHAGKPVSWQSISHAVYGGGLRPASARKDEVDNERGNLNVYVARLRRKLRMAGVPGEIVSHWGFGMELRQATVNRSKVAA